MARESGLFCACKIRKASPTLRFSILAESTDPHGHPLAATILCEYFCEYSISRKCPPYPMLTEKAIQALKPRAKVYRVADGGGLCIEVKPRRPPAFSSGAI